MSTSVKESIDLDAIKDIKIDIDNSVEEIKRISDDIVLDYTKDLDNIMLNINRDIINSVNVGDSILEKYFLELTNAIYFLGAKGEFLGLYDDFSKSNVRIKYNKVYSDGHIDSITNNKKLTTEDKKVAAESGSMNESLVNAIYSRSFKIVKSKLESANEMIKTLSKIISKRMNEKDYSDYSGS